MRVYSAVLRTNVPSALLVARYSMVTSDASPSVPMVKIIVEVRPRLILALHSFTPALRSKAAARPWEVALLYNTDDRAARHAIRLFAAEGLTVGDNEPYSGRDLNATMDRHAEAAGIPYCALEVRQDFIAGEAGQARWAVLIADVMERVRLALDGQ